MTTNGIRDKAAIVGIGQTRFSKVLEEGEYELGCQAAHAAIQDAGLRPGDIDGLMLFTSEGTEFPMYARALGITDLRFFSQIPFGGGAGPATFMHAAIAIASGAAKNVLIVRSRKRGSGGRPWAKGSLTSPDYEIAQPNGATRPVDVAALMASAFMHRYGWDSRTLGSVATSIRQHARRNPNACMRKSLPLKDHQSSKLIADPLRLYDCCLETDGAIAFVVTSTERARDLPHPPAIIHAAVQGMGQDCVHMAPIFDVEFPRTYSAHVARNLWRESIVGPNEISCAQLYDGFTIFVLIQLAEFGLIHPEEIASFVKRGGLLWNKGELPVNTSGGGLSEAYIHGMNLPLEGVRQLRRKSTCQVEDCTSVLVTGAPIVASSAMVLCKDWR